MWVQMSLQNGADRNVRIGIQVLIRIDQVSPGEADKDSRIGSGETQKVVVISVSQLCDGDWTDLIARTVPAFYRHPIKLALRITGLVAVE